jgi:hypothetical protein
MNSDDELWAFDEPHESGGNSRITMTRRQAIDWMKTAYPLTYKSAGSDEKAFQNWTDLHWAYRVTEASSTSQ